MYVCMYVCMYYIYVLYVRITSTISVCMYYNNSQDLVNVCMYRR